MKAIFSGLVLVTCAMQIQAQKTSTITVRAQKQEILNVAEEMPEFPGGMYEQQKYYGKNIVYPKIAKDSAYTGKCFIRFVVDTAGFVRDAKVLKGVPKCPECDREALRVINAMPRWKPGRQNGKPVNVYYNVPINFQMK